MIKRLSLLVMTTVLGACSSAPESASDQPAAEKGGCYQSEWQAETCLLYTSDAADDMQ